MTQHAPGQWTANKLSVYTNYGGNKSHKVADARQPLFTRECQEANARLIAAAPDLLEALAFLEPHLNALPVFEYERVKIRAAITKATGA